jgi:hypothetical protein
MRRKRSTLNAQRPTLNDKGLNRGLGELEKLQIPTSKLQRSFKLQCPKACTACSLLEFSDWNFIGAWMLELGAFDLQKMFQAKPWRDMRCRVAPHHAAVIDRRYSFY